MNGIIYRELIVYGGRNNRNVRIEGFVYSEITGLIGEKE